MITTQGMWNLGIFALQQLALSTTNDYTKKSNKCNTSKILK